MKALFVTHKFGDVKGIQAHLSKTLGKKVILCTTITALTLIKENNIKQVIVGENIDINFISLIKDCCPEIKIGVIIDSSIDLPVNINWTV